MIASEPAIPAEDAGGIIPTDSRIAHEATTRDINNIPRIMSDTFDLGRRSRVAVGGAEVLAGEARGKPRRSDGLFLRCRPNRVCRLPRRRRYANKEIFK
jgi:hypothetical protein